MTYTHSIEIPKESANDALDDLPMAVIGKKRCAGQPRWYPNKSFKRAPTWSAASQVVQCVGKLLEISRGRKIKHKSMRSEVLIWNEDKSLGLDDAASEDVAYSLRAIISQLHFHKDKSRTVPNMKAFRV